MKWVKVKFTAGSFVLASGRNRMEYLDLESMQMDLFGSEKVQYKIISVNGKKFNKAKKYLVNEKDNGVFFVWTKSGKTRFEFASRLLMNAFFDQCRKYIFSDFHLVPKESQKKKTIQQKGKNKSKGAQTIRFPSKGRGRAAKGRKKKTKKTLPKKAPSNPKAKEWRVEEQEHVVLPGPHSGIIPGASPISGMKPVKRRSGKGCNHKINGKECGRPPYAGADKCDYHN